MSDNPEYIEDMSPEEFLSAAFLYDRDGRIDFGLTIEPRDTPETDGEMWVAGCPLCIYCGEAWAAGWLASVTMLECPQCHEMTAAPTDVHDPAADPEDSDDD